MRPTCLTNSMKSNRGFTLIELIVVIAILAILSLILFPSIMNQTTVAKNTVCLSNSATLKRLYTYYKMTDNSFDPNGTTGAQFLIDAGLLNQGSSANSSINSMVWAVDESGEMQVGCASNTITNDTMLFKSSFDNSDNLKLLMGNWTIVNGVLTTTKAGESRAIFSGTSGTDYDIKMNAVYLSGNGGYGTYYRATENAAISGYCFQFDPGAGNRFLIRKVVDGKEGAAFISTTMSTVSAGFDPKAPHDIEISVVGDQHVIKVDGVTVMNFKDSTFTEGSVGVRTWSDAKVSIGDVSVEVIE